ncbi:pyruvate carboxyltransferase [Fadolivirus algeromassiliense]|jgi:hydroxymethylglutaryl-CoA lyase|uniref:Pyruvate carboxyltransferase n=1 Tax=Fadolivirus FV1/VV64 TaxID=3070911 RepID=A0A7D3UQ73_9VIRU|nr:pyruvate carboxyltransferase [Fadolivirus algeromassiliense]QKF93533.1 pyruvate carboxyltransferase [Fadolivirus FV1/VV64]
MNALRRIKLVEVGPRDGLQSVKRVLHPYIRATYINMLVDAGIKNIEVGSFVSKKVPQMQHTDEVMRYVKKRDGVNYIALVPNQKYAIDAIKSGVTELAVFTTISEQFSNRNSGCSISESLKKIKDVIELASNYNIPVRGYISCAFGCPYEGYPTNYLYDVRGLSSYLLDIGCSTISIADTIGTATPQTITNTLNILFNNNDSNILLSRVGIHLHDTHGKAVENMQKCIEMGIETFDCASGGLGGCPFAKGAPGNISTERVIDLFNSMNLDHGIDKNKVIIASDYIKKAINPLEIMEIPIAKL